MDLFTLDDLAAFLQQDLDSATAERCRRVAAGWLRSATNLSTWPDPVPDDLWAWAVELAALAYGNPGGWASETIGGISISWAKGRREEILAAAAARYPKASGVRLAVGSAYLTIPTAPDPAPRWVG